MHARISVRQCTSTSECPLVLMPSLIYAHASGSASSSPSFELAMLI